MLSDASRYFTCLIALLLGFPASGALTKNFAEPTTVSLGGRIPGFDHAPLVPVPGEQLSTESVVLSETDDTGAPAQVLPPPREPEIPAGQAGTSASIDLSALDQRLPVRADRSTTASQAMQLLRFERRNQIAEAYLLARDLVRRNPGDEFALDAAIRTSLVLGRTSDVESLYRQAVERARLPGKYYVQLAHWYLRTGQAEKLRELVAAFEKNAPRDGEYHLTLTRIRVIAEESAKARETVEEAIDKKKSPLLFPLVMLASHVSRHVSDPGKAALCLLEGAAQDYGPWEHRTQLLEYLKLPGITPEGLVTMVDAALVNEPNYRRARTIADRILSRGMEERIFYPLRTLLLRKILTDDASDVERWLAALTYEKEGDFESSLRLLNGGLPEEVLQTSSTLVTSESLVHHDEEAFMGGTTPVIAYERAVALARAGHHGESLALASNLLAEQPGEWALRLFAAEQQILLNQHQAALHTVFSWPLRRETDSHLRMKRVEVVTSAVLGLQSAEGVLEAWTQLAQDASFEDLRRGGEVLMQSRSGQTTRSEVLSLREQIESHLAATPGEPAPSVLLLRAFLAARENDSWGELQLLLAYLEEVPDDIEVLQHVAARAVFYANVALELAPGPGAPLALRATDSQFSQLALKLYRRIIELQPRAPAGYAALMRLHMMRGEADTARRVAAELAERDSSSPQVLALAARLLQDNGFAADSLVYYRQLIPRTPDDYELVVRYAAALRSAGKPDLAENILRKVLEDGLGGRSYAQGTVLRMLADIASDSGRTGEFADYLDSLRARTLPDKPAFLLRAAHLLSEFRMPDRTASMLAELQQGWPDSPLLPPALLLQARLHVLEEKGADAEQHYRAILEKHTTASEALVAARELADLLQHGGRVEEAVALLEQIATSHPARDAALALLLRAAELAEEGLKDQQKAQSTLERLLEEGCQEFSARRQAAAELKRLRR